MLKVCLPLQVEDRDLDAIGMSTLKKRRFRRGLQEEHDGVSFAERLSPIAKQQIDFDAAEGQFSDWAESLSNVVVLFLKPRVQVSQPAASRLFTLLRYLTVC